MRSACLARGSRRQARARTRCLMILVPTWIAALATVAFGVIPSPLVDWAANAGTSLFG